MESPTLVLVTGASGYLAAHCVRQLLLDGFHVRGTVRSLDNDAKVRPLRELAGSIAAESTGRDVKLELVEADLGSAAGWTDAVRGCTYVLHVASPFPIVADESIVKTAVDGTLNVLQACASRHSTVKKVVLTSSCAAINEGHEEEDRVFSEEDWTVSESKKVLAYPRSKTEAERAAWDFMRQLQLRGENEANHFRITCLNPTLIVGGPILIDTQGTSITIVRRFLNAEMPAVPALQLALVDVEDVAKAHVIAMSKDETDGERILLTAQPSFWFLDIAKILGGEFRDQGYWVPRLQVPYFFVWLYSFFDTEAKQILTRLGRKVRFSNSKARKLLGIEFTSPKKSLIEMAYSMIERGILPKKSGYRGPRSV